MEGFWIFPTCQLLTLYLRNKDIHLGKCGDFNKKDFAPFAFFFYFPESSAAAAAKLLQSYPTLWDPIDGSPPGSPVPRILQARTLEWVAISFSNAESSNRL